MNMLERLEKAIHQVEEMEVNELAMRFYRAGYRSFMDNDWASVVDLVDYNHSLVTLCNE